MKKDITYQKINRTPLKYLSIMIIATISINILSLALPLTMKQIYSNIIINKSVGTLLVLLSGCTVALILESILRKLKDSTSKWISAKYENLLSNYLINKTLNSYEEDSSAKGYNAIFERFISISRITNFSSTNFFQIYIDLPFMLIFLYLIWHIGGNIVIVPIFLSVVFTVFSLINSRLYSASRESHLKASEALVAQLTETLEKIHLVKSAGLEEFQITRYKNALKDATEAEFDSNKFQMVPENISAYFSQLTNFAILISGGYFMIKGNLSFGEITACALLGGRAIAPVQSIMSLNMQRKDINLLRSRLDQIAEKPDQYSKTTPLFPDDINGTVEIIDVAYTNIQTNKPETISWHIGAGSFACINPTEFISYGKIFAKMVGKEKITSGKILYDNLDITEWNLNGLKGKIEYLTDSINVFKGSVMDNITHFCPSKNQDVYEAAAITGLDILVNQMSDGFETKLDSHAINYLSSAFMQRLNLTRALLLRPRVLILDRIDESMDYDTLDNYFWLLDKLKGKLTVIIATSSPVIMKMADLVLSDHSV